MTNNESTESTESTKASTPTTTSGAAMKLPTPVLAILIAVGALLAGGTAFLATTKLMGSGSGPSTAELCQQGKDGVLAVKEAALDPAILDANPALSAQLSAAGEKIFNNCIYKDGREFEMQNVENWLIAPAAGAPAPADAGSTPAPGATTVPQPEVAPTTDGQ